MNLTVKYISLSKTSKE